MYECMHVRIMEVCDVHVCIYAYDVYVYDHCPLCVQDMHVCMQERKLLPMK